MDGPHQQNAALCCAGPGQCARRVADRSAIDDHDVKVLAHSSQELRRTVDAYDIPSAGAAAWQDFDADSGCYEQAPNVWHTGRGLSEASTLTEPQRRGDVSVDRAIDERGAVATSSGDGRETTERVSAKAELEGLDIPEMGALGYPEFELKARGVGA